MTVLALLLTRSGGLGRAALVAGCTAVVTALLLVAVAVLRLPARPQEALLTIVADPGVRPGTLLAVALLMVPPVLLLHQSVRLGTAARERRLAGLRLAGATVGDVRRTGALEVLVPALGGGVAGVLLFHALRSLLGGAAPGAERGPSTVRGMHLVPTTVGPAGWQVVAVVAAVGLLGAAVGWWGSRGLTVSPLGVSRRQPSRGPRPWGAFLLVLAVVLLVGSEHVSVVVDPSSTGYVVVVVALAVLGMTGLASWSALWTGRVAQRRASSASTLMAAGRLVAEPRPAGRAAAAVGGIALVSGGTAVVLGYALSYGGSDTDLGVSLVVVCAALLLALLVVVGSLAVHSTETALDHKRSMAALVAHGASTDDLTRSQRSELLLASLPVAVVGVVLGSVALLVFGGGSPGVVATVVLGNLVLTPALVVVAALLATALTRPIVRRAAAPENLRTE